MAGESKRGLVIVVTGFGPFSDIKENPSEMLVRRLAEEGLDDVDNCTLITEILPVAYNDVNQAVFGLWKTHKPDLVIHVGVHVDSGVIHLEQQSFGDGYITYDIRSQLPAGLVCPRSARCKTEENVIVSGLDCNKIMTNASAKLSCDCLRWNLSNNPGRFLCAYSYFISLSHDRDRSLFVHVPPLNDVPLDIVFKALKLIVNECVLQISKK